MNKSLLIAVITALPLSMPLAWAEESHHSSPDNKSATAMTDKDKQMQMGKMQEKMLRMHEQMHKIMQSKNAKEREMNMQEHAKMMQEHMAMMQGMKGGGMGHGTMGSEGKGGMQGQ